MAKRIREDVDAGPRCKKPRCFSSFEEILAIDNVDDLPSRLEEVATEILNRAILVVGNRRFRLVEIEFYLDAPGHEDCHAHNTVEQGQPLVWYFHRNSYMGLDFTFGGLGIARHGGVLLRSMEDLESGRLLSGIGDLVGCIFSILGYGSRDELIADLTKSEVAPAFPMAFSEKPVPEVVVREDPDESLTMADGATAIRGPRRSRRSKAEDTSSWQARTKRQPVLCIHHDYGGVLERRNVHSSPRVGLGVKGKYGVEQFPFLVSRQRFVSDPCGVKSGRPGQVLSMYVDGCSAATIHELTGCKKESIAKHIALFEQAVGQATPTTVKPSRGVLLADFCYYFACFHKRDEASAA